MIFNVFLVIISGSTSSQALLKGFAERVDSDNLLIVEPPFEMESFCMLRRLCNKKA